MAFLGAIGVVGFIIGIVLIILGAIKKKKYYGGLITILSFVLFVVAIAMTPNNDEKDTAKPSEAAKEEVNADISWQDKVKEVAAMEGNETEKADAIERYARNYQATDDELKEFEDYIIQEYKAGNYIMDISNHEYMLTNIFKSLVVERSISDETNPIKNFAFDFYQNCKYNYRGVDNMTSESTLSNEEQMNKALEEMGK